MPSNTTVEFESSLAELGVSRTRTTAETFREDLLEAVREPAVGATIPIDGLSLADTTITTRPTPGELDAAKTGVTVAEFGIASYGSVVVGDTPEGEEPVSLFPDLHVAIVHERDIVATMAAAFERLGPTLRAERHSAILATGPSATADMGALVQGAHGPEAVHVLIVTESHDR